MEPTRFDALTRRLDRTHSRRVLLGAGLAAMLTRGPLAGITVPSAVAAKHKAKRKPKRPKPCSGPFTTVADLQALIDGARAKSTVRLCAGTFTNTGFTIRKNLTIVGAGKDQTVLQGQWRARGPAMTIAAGVKVTLKDLSVTSNLNGAAGPASKGGGIYNRGRLTVTGCAVSGNIAGNGGGLYNDDNATLTLNATEVFDNTASTYEDVPGEGFGGRGGGIFNNQGTLTLNDAVVTGNEGYDGGGIGTLSGTAVLNGTKVTANRATYGGGIENWGIGRLEVRRGSVIGGNGGAGNSAVTGGGLYNENATAIFEKGTKVTGNSITNGGGARECGGILNDSGVVTLPDTTIVTGNLPSNCGGPDGGNGDPIPNCIEAACLPYGGFCTTASDCCDGVPCTAGRCRLT